MAVEHLKNKLGISSSYLVPIRLNASLEDVFNVVGAANKVYEHKENSLGRMRSAIKRPFELDYQDLANYTRECSSDRLPCQRWARAEIRGFHYLAKLQDAQIREPGLKLVEAMEVQRRSEAHFVQLLQIASSQNA